jgi:hypothetical protein
MLEHWTKDSSPLSHQVSLIHTTIDKVHPKFIGGWYLSPWLLPKMFRVDTDDIPLTLHDLAREIYTGFRINTEGKCAP